MRTITAARAFHIASQFGSYRDSLDPGACLYAFHYGDGRPVSDAHRSLCLIYLRAILNRRPMTLTVRDERHVRSLIRFLANCELFPVAAAA